MIAIVGGGRMGRGLATALADAGERIVLWSRREAAGAVEGAIAGAGTILLAVPDDAIAEVARQLSSGGAIEAAQTVLHLSGLHDRRALRALEPSGAALGSFHPLQTVSDPATAGARWRGAYAAIEGDPRAVAEGRRLADLLGLIPVEIPSSAKAAYHAGAVMASNYVIVLASIASRFAAGAGVAADLADRLYLPMITGAAENLQRQSAAAALTGPVRRGDVATLQAHLEAIPLADRPLYARLGLEALKLAREVGLEEAKAAEVERVLRDY
jgi:predicted short-subunit dehydrogenase-like oxidoreductase (DUF2520 family)